MRDRIVPVLLLSLAAAASGQEGPRGGDRRGPDVTFVVTNDTGREGARGVSHVRDEGQITFEMLVIDSRPKPGRRLQVCIAIYERDVAFPNRFKPGRLVETITDDTIHVAGGPETLIGLFCRDVKMPPGEYLYYVILCDPTMLGGKANPNDKPPLNLENLPGSMLCGKVCTATVR